MNFKRVINHNEHNVHNEEKTLLGFLQVRGWLNPALARQVFVVPVVLVVVGI
jgi:hypothetical protein